jgi:hypothetical protein
MDAQLLVRRLRQNPAYLVEHNTALQEGTITKYNLTRVKLKSFTFASGTQCHIGDHIETPIIHAYEQKISRLRGYESIPVH